MAKYYYNKITVITKDIINYYKKYKTVAEKQYYELIEVGKTRVISDGDDEYYEKHHILPKSLGGTNDPENLVVLTYTEHVLAHMLLHTIHPNDFKMAMAFSLMCGIRSNKNNEEKTQKIFSNKNQKSSFSEINIDLELLENLRIEAIRNPEFREHMKQVQSTPEYLERQRESTTERWKDEKYRNTILEKNRIHWNDPEYKKKQSEALTKSWADPEKRKIWIDAQNTEEYKIKLRESRKEVLARPEFQKKWEELKQSGIFNPWNKEEYAEKMRKVMRTPEYRQACSKASIKKWQNPEYRSKFTKPVQGPGGVIYDSVSEAARQNKKSVATIIRWIRNCPEKGFSYLDSTENN